MISYKAENILPYLSWLILIMSNLSSIKLDANGHRETIPPVSVCGNTDLECKNKQPAKCEVTAKPAVNTTSKSQISRCVWVRAGMQEEKRRYHVDF